MEGLRLEDRAGVPHYVPGQIKAWRTDEDGSNIALVRHCDRMGRAWLTCCEHKDGEWKAVMAIYRTAGGLSPQGWLPTPENFRFTDGILAAIENAAPFPEAVA